VRERADGGRLAAALAARHRTGEKGGEGEERSGGGGSERGVAGGRERRGRRMREEGVRRGGTSGAEGR